MKNLNQFKLVLLCLLISSMGSSTISAQCTDNLLPNGDFENGANGWDGEFEIAFDASINSQVIKNCVGGTTARTTLDALPGESYTLSALAKRPANISAFVRLKFMNSNYVPIQQGVEFVQSDAYQTYSLTETAPASAAFVEVSISFSGGNGSGCISADDICLTIGSPSPELPDLIVEDVIPVVTSVEAGEVIGVQYKIINQGTVIPFSDLPFTASLYLSSDLTIDASDVLLDSLLLGPGVNTSGGTIPANLPAGLYYALVEADVNNVIPESNENNNVGASIQRITVINGEPGVGDIDLSLSLFQPIQNPSQWSVYSVLARVENSGPQTATGVKVKFPKPDGVVYTGGNEYTATQGNFDLFNGEIWHVGAIPAGGFVTLTVNYFLKLPESPILYAEVIAANETDVDSTPNNGTPPAVNEDDEANGGGAGPSNEQADLSTSFANPPFNVQAGEVVNFDFDLINDGNATASGDYIIGIYLSEDFTYSPDDILVGEVSTGNTSVGTIADVQGAAAIPANTPTGTYGFILRVDINNAIAESDETNNIKVNNIQVFMAPPPPPPSEGCGFEKDIGSVGDINQGFSAGETSNGYEVQARNRFFVGGQEQIETFNVEIDLNGDLQNLSSTVVSSPSFFQAYTFVEDIDAQTIEITRNLPGGGVDWTRTIDFNIGAPVLDVSTISAVDIVDGSLVALSLVVGPIADLAFNELYIKLDDSGMLINQDYNNSINGQILLNGFQNSITNTPTGYILNYRGPGSCLGYIGLDLDGNYVWNDQFICDLPSNRVAALAIGPNNEFVYAANRNNQQCFINKYNIATGELIYEININTLFGQGLVFQSSRFFRGLVFSDDGGLVCGNTYLDTNDGNIKYGYGKIDANGALVWVKNFEESRRYEPLIQTSDGGYLFAQVNEGELMALKITSNGDLTPTCGETTPPPSGEALPCELSYTLDNGTLTIDGPGLNAGHVIIKVFDPHWNTLINCVDNCGDPLVLNNITMNGEYHFSVNTYDANWSPLCDGKQDIPVGNSSNRLAQTDASLLRVYPNPAKDYVLIDATEFIDDDIQLQIIDQLGNPIPQSNLSINSADKVYEVDLSGIQDGVYTIWVQRTGKKLIGKKLVVISGR